MSLWYGLPLGTPIPGIDQVPPMEILEKLEKAVSRAWGPEAFLRASLANKRKGRKSRVSLFEVRNLVLLRAVLSAGQRTFGFPKSKGGFHRKVKNHS